MKFHDEKVLNAKFVPWTDDQQKQREIASRAPKVTSIWQISGLSSGDYYVYKGNVKVIPPGMDGEEYIKFLQDQQAKAISK
jgi:hypothetical protein